MTKRKKLKIRKVLLVRPDALGDVTLMIPMINTLKENYPSIKISVLMQRYAAPLLENHPNVDHIILDWKKEGKCNSVSEFFAYARAIKACNFDAVIFSYLDAFYAWLSFFAGIKIRIGDGQKIGLRFLLTHPINQYFRKLSLHETEQNNRLLEVLSPNLKKVTRMDLYSSEQSEKDLGDLLRYYGLSDKKYIIIHPATGGGNRAWLPQKYAELINMIHEKSSWNVVITGFGKKEYEINEQIIKYCHKRPYNFYEKTTLDQLKVLIKKSLMVIGTDTGPTHMAAALGIPVVCISPTKFVKSLRWGPWQVKNAIVGEPGSCPLSCNPYKCKETFCLDAISAETVFLEMNRVINVENETSFSKSNWLKASINIGLCVSTEKEFEIAQQYQEKLKIKNFRVKLLITNKKLLTHLNLNSDYSYLNMVNVFSLIRIISSQDINCIHIVSNKKIWFWKLIRQLAAPFMYCPPVIIPGVNQSKNVCFSDFYLKAFSE